MSEIELLTAQLKELRHDIRELHKKVDELVIFKANHEAMLNGVRGMFVKLVVATLAGGAILGGGSLIG